MLRSWLRTRVAFWNYSVADTWELLAGVTGKNGGAVYVYKTNDGNRVTADVTATNILASNLVEVNDFDVNSDGDCQPDVLWLSVPVRWFCGCYGRV